MAATTLWARSNGLNGKMKPTLIWISTLLACIYLVNARSASPYYSELRALAAPTQENENPLSSMDLWRYILSMDARSKIFPTNYRRTIGTDQARKRGGSSSCLFNAGLAHNCDYRDVVGAVNEMNHWGSDLAPGKRKKREVTSRQQQQQQQEIERTSDVEQQNEDYPVGLLRELIERNRILMERNQRF